MKKVVKASESTTYEVEVQFCGFIGAEEYYTVAAHNEQEAIEDALKEAAADLSATDVEEVDEGEYEVTVNFGGYIGADETYTVYADDEEEAGILAEEEAQEDLSASIVSEDEDEEDEDEE